MSDVVAFRRTYRDGTQDRLYLCIDETGCYTLSQVWVACLNRGDFRSIELRLSNGQTVIVKPLPTLRTPESQLERIKNIRVKKAVEANKKPFDTPLSKADKEWRKTRN